MSMPCLHFGSLDLSDCSSITDVSALCELTQLQTLNLSECFITNVSFLTALT
jgi:Leucine-rich repeat (LRR) protein